MRYNVSVVGHTGDHVWIAKRSDKVEHPNKLDHMVSGCCTTEYNILEAVADEAHDEAGLNSELIEKVRPLGRYQIISLDKNGDIFHEFVNLFEIKLPEDYTPKTNQPDEITGFNLISFDQVNDELLNHDNLLYFSKIVFIYFLIKIGYISENNKEYRELIGVFNYNRATDIAAY